MRLNLLKSLMKRGEKMSEEKLALEVRLVEDVDLKDRVYEYIKFCEGQLDPQLCAVDLHVPIEDVMKAIALLESEGKIKVEATPTVTEPEKPADIMPDEFTVPDIFSEKMPTEDEYAPEEVAKPTNAYVDDDMPIIDFDTVPMMSEEPEEEETKPPVSEPSEDNEVPPTTVHVQSNEIVITQDQIVLEKPKVRNATPAPTVSSTPQTAGLTELEHVIPPPQAITQDHTAKKPVKVFLYKCPTCGNMLRSTDTLGAES